MMLKSEDSCMQDIIIISDDEEEIIMISDSDEEDYHQNRNFKNSDTLGENEIRNVLDIPSDGTSAGAVALKQQIVLSDDSGDESASRKDALKTLPEHSFCPNLINVSLLRGGLLRCSKQHCSISMQHCLTFHNSQGEANPSSLSFFKIIETMVTNHALEAHALLYLLRKGITNKKFLSLDLMKFLLKSMIGEVFMDMNYLDMGFNILIKMLRYHPPCRVQMLKYYKKVSHEFFWILISKVEKALEETNEDKSKLIACDDVTCDFPADIDECLAVSARQKQKEREHNFLNMTIKEKLQRLSIVFKFFRILIEENVLNWLFKCSRPKYVAFRRDSCPIIVSLIWESVGEEGHTNSNCRRLINLLNQDLELQMRRDIIKIISAISAVMFIKDKSQIGYFCEDFAREISLQLKGSSSFWVNFDMLEPAWLKFHAACLLLHVEVPANVSKLKNLLLQFLGGSLLISSVSEEETWCKLFTSMCVILYYTKCDKNNCTCQRELKDFHILLQELPDVPVKFENLLQISSCII